MIVVAADTGSRAIYGDYTHAGVLQPGELQTEWFAGAKVLLIDHFGPPTILAGAKLAKKAGLLVVSDIERDSPELAETRQYIDYLVCSAEFAVPYTQSETPAACEALERTGRHAAVVVTAGEQGCYYCTADNPHVKRLPGHPVKAVDTTGCGDVFHGVFCHGLAAGWPLERIITWANAGAAIKATRTGGWMAVPTLVEIEQILRKS
jgi:sugar/nucleoside kinase (ribokinase family)